jgi:hypothetical protein
MNSNISRFLFGLSIGFVLEAVSVFTGLVLGKNIFPLNGTYITTDHFLFPYPFTVAILLIGYFSLVKKNYVISGGIVTGFILSIVFLSAMLWGA